MSSSSNRQRGFSLTELMIVIAFIGLLATIAISKIDHIRYQAEAGLQAVATTLLAAQRSALTQEYDVIVSFDVPNSRMTILYDADNDAKVDVGERVRQIALEPMIAFGRGSAPARPIGTDPVNLTRMIGGLPSVIFHRNGSASSAGGLYITTRRALADSRYQADTRALEIIRATGRTEWWRYNGTAWMRGF